MKRDPSIIFLSPSWLESLNENQVELPYARWVPARPLGYPSLRERIKAAWLVWTGRADALIWPGQ
jgi:hypothetical protein